MVKPSLLALLPALCLAFPQDVAFPDQANKNNRIVNNAFSSGNNLGCRTVGGERCIFPFTYRGARYSGCTRAVSPTPWCATRLDSSGEVVRGSWGDCASGCPVDTSQQEQGSTGRCTTESGPSPDLPCVFPFEFNGVTYRQCTDVRLGRAWCSTATYPNGTHINGQGRYGFCPSSCLGAGTGAVASAGAGSGAGAGCRPGQSWTADCNTCVCSPEGTAVCTEKSCGCTPGTTFTQDCNTCVCNREGVAVCTLLDCGGAPPTAPPSQTGGRCRAASGPAAGKECVFPFSYAGRTYSSCAEWTWQGRDRGRLWCSTRTDVRGRHVNGVGEYGFCSGSCGTAQQVGTTPVVKAGQDLSINGRSKLQQDQDDSKVVFGEEEEESSPPN